MTGIYGNSQEDKIRERELDKYTEKDNYTYDDANLEKPNYKFPDYLNFNAKFMQLVKMMNYAELNSFLYYIAIIADEKVERDERHWASDELNVFLNKMVKDRGAK